MSYLDMTKTSVSSPLVSHLRQDDIPTKHTFERLMVACGGPQPRIEMGDALFTLSFVLSTTISHTLFLQILTGTYFYAIMVSVSAASCALLSHSWIRTDRQRLKKHRRQIAKVFRVWNKVSIHFLSSSLEIHFRYFGPSTSYIR
ncbi:hypothetical protein M422DRAFT_272732 [Sphaerobolus stellatus SS14]|uniref:Uncharacterized protein n=1 Tax=Sphaerobolus stellatus (strain SS14) TaxID=990650 RepID=A0A0C9TWL4_SPHS4|nr:hypothetical protein M422DRAFT_272732 [Sphaerobolus stellatus SS14]